VFCGYIGSAVDITDRKLLERQLQELGGRLIDAQEQERARIARELHDDLGQRMALLQVGIEQFAERLGDLASEPLQQLRTIREAATRMSSSIHDLSHELHPLTLEAVGLVPALRSLCREFGAQHGVRVRFVDRDVPERLAGAARVCLFRVAQEALRNVVMHSGVTEAAMKLSGHDSGVELCITDRGRGFSPATAGGTPGLGLVSMRERVRLLGGELDIRSAPGEGTRIVARLGALASSEERAPGAARLRDADRAGDWTDHGQLVRGDPSA
jgi:signal transduction histidine kinase